MRTPAGRRMCAVRAFAAATSLLALAGHVHAQAPPDLIRIVAEDGLTVFADLYLQDVILEGEEPLVILFHQAGGDARGEYRAIVPRLLANGYAVLAVDQRSGGDRFGGPNRTASSAHRVYEYCEAYPDLEAAVAWARGIGHAGRIAVWGSSYSAALVIRLAADHPEDIDAALAFSPASGGPMAACRAEEVLDRLHTPTLALRPASEMENPAVAEQARVLEASGVTVFVSDGGVHGSSMLDPDRAAGDVEPAWEAVLDFLRDHTETARTD